MTGQSVAPRLSPREREIAGLIGLGLTNKEIARRLTIKERTVGAHVQNIFNKLGASNRVEVATWWTLAVSPRPASTNGERRNDVVSVAAVPPPATLTRTGGDLRTRAVMAACCVALLVVGASDGTLPTAATSAAPLIPGDLPVTPGELAFQSKMDGVHTGFGEPVIVGDQSSALVRIVKGAVEYAVLKPGGLASDGPYMRSLPSYFAEVQITVAQGSLVAFWFSLNVGDSYRRIGSYVVGVNTYYQYLQLGYFVQGEDVVWLASPIPMNGLQTGRSFTIAALVNPPRYVVYLEGRRVIDVKHAPSPPLQLPSFQIFGDGVGAVRITALSVYSLKPA